MDFPGFPRRVRFTPVPNPLFGTLLEQIDDLDELKCTLRVVWLLHQKKGYPRFVALTELLADRTLIRAVIPNRADRRAAVEAALARAVRRGSLVSGSVNTGGRREQVFALNTEADRKALATVRDVGRPPGAASPGEAWEGTTERPNIYALYEDNVGMLSPMIAEELKEAEQLYPPEWIEDAFREAVSLNKRSWRYIARVLERWERDGRSDGRAGRYPKETGDPQYLRR